MIKINLVCVGKVKEKYFAEGIAEYSKRLKRFCDFTVTEVAEENVKDGAASPKTITEREGKNILSKLRGKVLATAIEGKKYSSACLAEEIERFSAAGFGEITFVVGGSYGLSQEVKDRADALISFSVMTFPHTLFRLMLTEQIYRAFCILAGTPYHK